MLENITVKAEGKKHQSLFTCVLLSVKSDAQPMAGSYLDLTATVEIII